LSAVDLASLRELFLASLLYQLAFAAIVSTAAVAANAALAKARRPSPIERSTANLILKPSTLPNDLGDHPAPVVEYGSLTCPHCAVFSQGIFPGLKRTIDTGKVGPSVNFRATRSALQLSSCALRRRRQGVRAVELLFSQQDKWAFVDKPLEPDRRRRPAGLTHDQAMTCLRTSREPTPCWQSKRATDEIKMTGTPTFSSTARSMGASLASTS
jgi:hypothetical protein